jgi:branched-subunit amino acid ABC-type transport system permease component
MDVFVHLFCVFAVLCVGGILALGGSPVQAILLTVYRIKKLKKSQIPKGCRAIQKKNNRTGYSSSEKLVITQLLMKSLTFVKPEGLLHVNKSPPLDLVLSQFP